MRSLFASLAVVALLAGTMPASAQSEPKGEPQGIVLGQVRPSFQGVTGQGVTGQGVAGQGVAGGAVQERLEREGDVEGLSPGNAARRGTIEDGDLVEGRSGKQS